MNVETLPGARGSALEADLARNFGVKETVVIATSMRRPGFGAIEWRVDQPTGQLSDTIPPEDAYVIAVQLDGGERPKNYWEEGRPRGRYVRVTGESAISDLRREPRILVDAPVHSLLLYLPSAALVALAEEAGLPKVTDLRFEPGAGIRDETFWGLGQALLPALRAPERTNRLFTDHVALALASHASAVYGGRDPTRPIRGGLAPWQERRAKDMILADLAGETPMADIAAACNLSASHFARSFRRSTGLAPHAWLLRARVQQAMVLLRRRDESLSAIAHACGFADQSHFARVFNGHLGMNPSTWRRLAAR